MNPRTPELDVTMNYSYVGSNKSQKVMLGFKNDFIPESNFFVLS